MTEAEQILQLAGSVLVVDWPSRDVPETLAMAGYAVLVRGGPEPDNYSVYESRDGKVVARHLGRAPDQIDLLYCHRPLDELPGIVAIAKRDPGASAVVPVGFRRPHRETSQGLLGAREGITPSAQSR